MSQPSHRIALVTGSTCDLPLGLFVSIVSPVLGVHTGPRTIALCGYAG